VTEIYYFDMKRSGSLALKVAVRSALFRRPERNYSLTTRNNSLVLIGAGVAVSAIAANYALQAYQDYAADKEKNKPNEADEQGSPSESSKETEEPVAAAQAKSTTGEAKEGGTTGGINFDFLNMFGKNFYEGGFEDKMTKREAALILGVRESATIDRIKDAHRRILLNNHPDRGGSPYLASKVNEAKDLLMKSKSTP
jgi:DnaJ family protein C protein 19